MTSYHKIAGYTLLLVGVLLIILPLWQTFQIFTGKALPPQIFMKPIQVPSSNASAIDIQGQVQNALLKILPIDLINNTLNLGNWLILMWIMIFGGGKLADIGVKLVKD